jgi:lysine biosynthesis protein LysW
MASTQCSECDEEIEIAGRPRLGQKVMCNHCGAQLEVIATDPLEVEIAQEEDDDLWDDDELEDEDELEDDDDLDAFEDLDDLEIEDDFEDDDFEDDFDDDDDSDDDDDDDDDDRWG